MKRRSIILIAIVMLFIAGGFAIFYISRPVSDIRTSSPDIEITAKDLVSFFEEKEQEANEKFVNKIILVKGKVLEISTDSTNASSVFLDSGNLLSAVACSFYPEEYGKVIKLQPGEEVEIKGVCTGKLADVILNRCSITENSF